MAVTLHVPDVYDLVAELEPLQGTWTLEQYLRLTDYSSRLLEFTDGHIEVLPMPTEQHQEILGFLYVMLRAYLLPLGGKVFFAPLRLQIREGKFREPDLLLVRDARDPRRHNAGWRGADLVMEVVSPDNPERDTVEKRADYAEARIPEYWIVHPQDETITVLRLADDAYAPHGVFRPGDTATSVLLPGFGVSVSEVFAAR